MVIRSGLGEVTDVDVKMAVEFKAAIFAFNVKTKAAGNHLMLTIVYS
jgi:translation initiation factor IF-2